MHDAVDAKDDRLGVHWLRAAAREEVAHVLVGARDRPPVAQVQTQDVLGRVDLAVQVVERGAHGQHVQLDAAAVVHGDARVLPAQVRLLQLLKIERHRAHTDP